MKKATDRKEGRSHVFLVDFENVRSNGLRGADYLDENDYLTLFLAQLHIAAKIAIWKR